MLGKLEAKKAELQAMETKLFVDFEKVKAKIAIVDEMIEEERCKETPVEVKAETEEVADVSETVKFTR